MRISELISKLEQYKQKHGDVVLYGQKSDGRSSWNSPINFEIKYTEYWPSLKEYHHYINLTGGY